MKQRLTVASAIAALAMLSAAPAHAGDDMIKEVRKALDALNDAFTAGKADAMMRYMTADHLAVTPYYGKPLSRNEQIKSLADTKLTEYKASKMAISPLGKDVALVTYHATLKGTYQGRALPPRVFATAVWVRQDGHWLERFYQETAVPDR